MTNRRAILTIDIGRDAAAYLVFSLLTGFLELGAITYAARQEWSTYGVLGVALAYQAGTLLVNPIKLTGRAYRLLACAAGGLAAVGDSPWILGIAIVFLSAGLHGLREQALRAESVSTLAKRSSRIAGFAAAGIFNPGTLVVMSIFVVVLSFAFLTKSQECHRATASFPKNPGALGIAMVVHQSHYFTYAYAIPLLFLRDHDLSATMVGIVFALGWLSYSAAPLLLANLRALPTVLMGHIAVASVLVVMTFATDRLDVLLIAWFLTGFGGGTVFCIHILANSWPEHAPANGLDTWENMGHIAGVLIAIAVTVLTGKVTLLFLVAAAFAVVTAAIISFTARVHSLLPSPPIAAISDGPISVISETDHERSSR